MAKKPAKLRRLRKDESITAIRFEDDVPVLYYGRVRHTVDGEISCNLLGRYDKTMNREIIELVPRELVFTTDRNGTFVTHGFAAIRQLCIERMIKLGVAAERYSMPPSGHT